MQFRNIAFHIFTFCIGNQFAVPAVPSRPTPESPEILSRPASNQFPVPAVPSKLSVFEQNRFSAPDLKPVPEQVDFLPTLRNAAEIFLTTEAPETTTIEQESFIYKYFYLLQYYLMDISVVQPF